MERFQRLKLLIGEQGLKRLADAKVLVAGLGGVGSFCAEALVRCGVGTVGALDSDVSEPSNLNRQLFALESTLSQPKTDAFIQRAREINPDIQVETWHLRLNRETFQSVGIEQYDVVADCIDALVPKLNLILYCLEQDIPVVASTGAGFKLDPTQVTAGSIWDTRIDPLAHRMRKKLRQWGYGSRDFPVVYSREHRPEGVGRGETIGSIVTVTGTFGLTVAAQVLEILLARRMDA